MNFPFSTTKRSLKLDIDVLRSALGNLAQKLAYAREEIRDLRTEVEQLREERDAERERNTIHMDGEYSIEFAANAKDLTWTDLTKYFTGEPQWDDVADHVWVEDEQPDPPRQQGKGWLYTTTEDCSE